MQRAVQLAEDSCGPAFAKDAFLKSAFKPILDAAVAVCASTPSPQGEDVQVRSESGGAPAPAADALLALPAHQRSPDPYPLFRAAAAHKLKVPVWSSYFFLGGLRRWEREPLQVLSGSARGLAAGAVEPL